MSRGEVRIGNERSFRWPGAALLDGYRREWLRGDLVAGITVCLVMIPSVIAYSELAGVAPAAGLYASLAAMVIYPLFGSSRHLISGPDAAISLLVGSAIAPLAQGDSIRAAGLAGAIAVLSGIFMMVAARLQVGGIADLLSKPVLVGYINGTALIIISTQIGKLLGVQLTRDEFFGRLAEAAAKMSEAHGPTLLLGLALITLLIGISNFSPALPGPLIAFLAALVLARLLNLGENGVAMVGNIPQGLPVPKIPALSWHDVNMLMSASVGVAFLIFSESVLLARSFASKNRYDINANQELVALSLSNITSGFFQGIPVSGSQTRTAINDATGSRSQVSQLISAVALALFLLLLARLIAGLPAVTLAAILIVAGVRLIEAREMSLLRKVDRRSFRLSLLVTLGVLTVGLIPAILAGVALSLIHLIVRVSRPRDAVLKRLSNSGNYHDLSDEQQGTEAPGLLVYRVYAALIFANAPHFSNRVKSLVASSPSPVEWVIIDSKAINDIDITAAEYFHSLSNDLADQGISLKVAGANRPLRETLERIGLTGTLGEDCFFDSVASAVETFERRNKGASAASGN